MRQECFLSIDFEDANHDFKRASGVEADPDLSEQALWASYRIIEEFCQSHLDGIRLTFFCTGIIAEKCPQIVEKIAQDGHEVACHFHYHDRIFEYSPEAFEHDLQRAIYYLRLASKQKIRGFRAPFFSLTNSDKAYFEIIEKYFEYDSSLVLEDRSTLKRCESDLSLSTLTLLPVFVSKISLFLPRIGPGGTYLKLLPVGIVIRMLENILDQNVSPSIYLHPYEFLSDMSFKTPLADMKGLPLHKKIAFWIRQYQWHYVGNNSVQPKLKQIFSVFKFGGPMRNLLATRQLSISDSR